jgi:hypothetical protein
MLAHLLKLFQVNSSIILLEIVSFNKAIFQGSNFLNFNKKYYTINDADILLQAAEKTSWAPCKTRKLLSLGNGRKSSHII